MKWIWSFSNYIWVQTCLKLKFNLVWSLPVFGHKAFTPMLFGLNSSDIPRTHMLIPYFAIVYATWSRNHLGFIFSGGDIFSTWGLFLLAFKYGSANFVLEIVTNIIFYINESIEYYKLKLICQHKPNLLCYLHKVCSSCVDVVHKVIFLHWRFLCSR